MNDDVKTPADSKAPLDHMLAIKRLLRTFVVADEGGP